MKTSRMKQSNIHTTSGVDDIKVRIRSLHLCIPTLNPNAQTQLFFNESFRKSFTLSFDPWSTDKKSVKTGNEYQLDVESALNVNSLLYIFLINQHTKRKNPARPPN